jgi:hypothetical protein
MNTQISSKLAAVLVALMMNSLIFGGVAYLFDVSSGHGTRDSSLASRPDTEAGDAAHNLV